MNKKIAGFTLIEVSIVIAIFGVLASAIFKGMDVLESAKIHAVKQDFEKYRHAILSYQEQFQALPGDDARANERFGIDNGNGNGIIDEQDISLFWVGLHKARLVASDKPPPSRLGGEFSPVYHPFEDMPGHWLCLSGKNGDGLLTPHQAQKLQGEIVIKDGKNQEGCLRNGALNLESKAAVCVAYLGF